MSVFTGVVDQLKKITDKLKKLSSIQFWGKDMISEFDHLGAISLVWFQTLDVKFAEAIKS